ncbi:phage shock protein A [Neolewinella xylanilytica]|uniref:Phage shock protein A n=1 Tax=Neolewinella xylanilytica TaxID=1514080 RepID=A0A2S6I439_9BACT|nr:hypothetical protein [Neolewinella xylanilytica]PPK85947.1 phage shock protein A [Neolewinella xylanilytica]
MTPPDTSTRKSFWQRPEGVTGLVFLVAILAGLGFLFTTFAGVILPFLSTTLGLVVAGVALLAVVFAIADPRTRTLFGYLYKSAMRKVTGLFVNIDPIGILKTYVEELERNLQEMRKQIGKIRGQMRHLTTLMETNEAEVKKQLKLAALAKEKGKNQQMILSSRRAARLRESNEKYQVLLRKMEVLNRVLNRMHQNSEVLLEDTRDQVDLRIQERKAIRASHGAMQSAMSVINGDPDQRAMFDQAMEAIAEDVANKVGEMERMMELSNDFMASVDLQNGVFADEGLRMLEEWEKKSDLLLSEGHIEFDLDKQSATSAPQENLNLEELTRRPDPQARERGKDSSESGYDQFFS